jgi:hypothetical protein
VLPAAVESRDQLAGAEDCRTAVRSETDSGDHDADAKCKLDASSLTHPQPFRLEVGEVAETPCQQGERDRTDPGHEQRVAGIVGDAWIGPMVMDT